jgi:Ring finger domain
MQLFEEQRILRSSQNRWSFFAVDISKSNATSFKVNTASAQYYYIDFVVFLNTQKNKQMVLWNGNLIEIMANNAVTFYYDQDDLKQRADRPNQYYPFQESQEEVTETLFLGMRLKGVSGEKDQNLLFEVTPSSRIEIAVVLISTFNFVCVGSCLICIGIKAKRKMVIQRHLDQGEREPQIQLGDFMHSERITQTKRLEVINRVKDSLIRSQFMEIKKCMERNQETCPICLEEYQEQCKVLLLPMCCHVFHQECLEAWLDRGNLKCPFCNRVMSDHAEVLAQNGRLVVDEGNLGSDEEDELDEDQVAGVFAHI